MVTCPLAEASTAAQNQWWAVNGTLYTFSCCPWILLASQTMASTFPDSAASSRTARSMRGNDRDNGSVCAVLSIHCNVAKSPLAAVISRNSARWHRDESRGTMRGHHHSKNKTRPFRAARNSARNHSTSWTSPAAEASSKMAWASNSTAIGCMRRNMSRWPWAAR
ncbi:hypothetical protein BC828DRAFT_376161 [Blastocladiella britannica]|nr:hypothetical protein BC828DRAFT_376161 [Blastocladiella britannica]